MNKESVIEASEEIEGIEGILNIKYYLYLFIKRIVDIFCSLIGMVFLIPLTIFIKIAFLLTGDRESIFYFQERIGKNGKAFKLFKYRTMILNADEVLNKMLEENKEMAKEYKKYKKLDNDPRVTKVGNILRKLSLDEFPQFINILVGDMSLVGPRPYLFREKKDMGKHFDNIIQAKPGLTGYWQVNGRSNTDFKERLLLDEEYIKIRGLFLDLKIVFMTFIQILKRDGAK